jgi:hypothetical protein
MSRTRYILRTILPIVLMIALIPYVKSDAFLAVLYLLIIGLMLLYRYEKHDLLALLIGIVVMTLSESFFISQGVEIFAHTSLFGLMPIWLPLLWGAAFIAIKRILKFLQ